MPMNLPPLPVSALPVLHEHSVTPARQPPSSSSSPPDLPVAHDQSVAEPEIHDQMLPRDTVVTVEEEEDEEERRARKELSLKEEWVRKMRGWLMVLATLASSVTYNAGLNPPGGFWQDDLPPSNSSVKAHTAGNPVLADKSPARYRIFFVCNASAFATSIAIIVLLLNQGIFQAELRLFLLKGSMLGGMFLLIVAFVAGSTRDLVDISGTVAMFVWTFLYLIFRVSRSKKKLPARRPISSQETDVELETMGQQTLP